MSDFNFDLFTKPNQYEETLLRDRKQRIEYWIDDEKAEFVRDVIALANTARMMGRPAYLILGVRDKVDGTPADICGIGEMFDRQIRQGKTEKQAFETMRHEMVEILRRYVAPPISPDLKFEKYEGKVVGYILIPPLRSEPFQVTQEFRSGRKTFLRPNQCWLRFGESKHEITREDLAPDHDQLRYCFAEVPYVLPSIWESYFEQVQRYTLRLTQDAPKDAAYQELRDGKGAPIQKVVDDFLAQSDERLLILQGAAGCGKSLFLQRLVNSLAKQGVQDMKDAQRLEQFTPPTGLTPIFLKLRDLTYKARTDSAYFTKVLSNLLAPMWKDNEQGQSLSHSEKLFENHHLNWLILLDGLDEIGEYKRRRAYLRTLAEFMRAYPRLYVILTTRPSPGVSLEGIDNAKLVQVAPLDENQIIDFLMAYRTDRSDEEINAFIQECHKWEDAWRLLSVPAYLNAAVFSIGVPRTIIDVPELPNELRGERNLPAEDKTTHYAEFSNAIIKNYDDETGVNASLEVFQSVTEETTERLDNNHQEEFVLTLPRLLDQVYEAFWKREEKRNILENSQHLRFLINKLAATFMKNYPARVNRDQAKRCFNEKRLRWTLEMGIFSENEYEHVFFTIPSAQVYSAAKKLQGDIEGCFWDTISRYSRNWHDTYHNEIEYFYESITGKFLSTILQHQGDSNG